MRSIVMIFLAAAIPTWVSALPVRIHAARVLDGRGSSINDATLVVDGSKIVAIEKGSDHPNYDFPNGTIMPGGIDTHVHIDWHFDPNGRTHDDDNNKTETPQQTIMYAAENGYVTLLGGVTTVQSLGAPIDKDYRDALARGLLAGPTVLTAIDPIYDEKIPPEKLRELVRKLKADGADVVKIFASKSIRDGGGPTMSQEQMNAICGEANALGMRTAVHAHGPESVKRAVLAGCRSIEHGALVDQATLDLMAAHGTYFDPNIDLVFRNYFENKSKFLGIGNYTEEGFAYMEKAVPVALEMFKKALKTKGLKIVFGTDALAGSHGRNFQELEYRVDKGGQDPMQAIVSATSLAAESLGIGDHTGSIAPTYDADVIVVDGNPLTDIRSLERVSFVMKGGRVVKNVAFDGERQTLESGTNRKTKRQIRN